MNGNPATQSERQLQDQEGTTESIDSDVGETTEQPNVQPDRQCARLKPDGERCQAQALTGSRLCFFHDPAAAAERTAAQKRGGEKNRPAVLPAETPDFPLNNSSDADKLLATLINQVLRGQLDAKVANAVGYLLGLKMKAADVGKLEQRLAAMEAAVKENQPAVTLFDLDNESGGGVL